MNFHNCVTSVTEQDRSFCRFCGVLVFGKTRMLRSPERDARSHQPGEPARVYASLVRRQSKNRLFHPQAPHLEFRGELVEFVERLVCKLEYSVLTLHTAVAFLDAILNLYAVAQDQMNLIAYVCTIMAAKMNEPRDVPPLKDAVKLFGDSFSKEHIKTCEATIFKALNFNLNVVTPLHFLEYFLSIGVVSREELGNPSAPDRTTKVGQIETLCYGILLRSLKEYQFYRFLPLTIALSAIEAAKDALGLDRAGTSGLQHFTTISASQLADCRELMSRSACLPLDRLGERSDDPHTQELVRKQSEEEQLSHSSFETNCVFDARF